MSAITPIVIGAEMSATKSPWPFAAAASRISRVISSTWGASSVTVRGVNCFAATRR